jgi:hypothetical protein
MTLKQMAAKLRHAADVLDELMAVEPEPRTTKKPKGRRPRLTPAQEKKRRKNLQKHFAKLRALKREEEMHATSATH